MTCSTRTQGVAGMATRREQLLERAARPEEPATFGMGTRFGGGYGENGYAEGPDKKKLSPDDRRRLRLQKYMLMLDRNLLVKEDSRLFYDSIYNIARIAVAAMKHPLLPDPSDHAVNNAFMDAVSMYANVPKANLVGKSKANNKALSETSLGVTEDPYLRQLKEDLQTYVDSVTSERDLLLSVRKANGPDGSRVRAAYESALLAVKTLVGSDNQVLLDFMDSKGHPERWAASAEHVAKRLAPFINACGNVRFVPPAHATGKMRSWGYRMWNTYARQQWYEQGSMAQDSVERLLLECMKHHMAQGTDSGQVSMVDVAVLGGLNPRTFFDVWAWYDKGVETTTQKEQARERILNTFRYFFEDVRVERHDLMPTKHNAMSWTKRQERAFNMFWYMVNKRLDESNRPLEELIKELKEFRLPHVDRYQLQHLVYDTPMMTQHGAYMPSTTKPFPMRSPTIFGGKGQVAAADQDDDDDDDDDYDFDPAEENWKEMQRLAALEKDDEIDYSDEDADDDPEGLRRSAARNVSAEAGEDEENASSHPVSLLEIYISACLKAGIKAYAVLAHEVTRKERERTSPGEDATAKRFGELFARLVGITLALSHTTIPHTNKVYWERQLAELQFQRVEVKQQIATLCGARPPVDVDQWMSSASQVY